MDPQTSAAADSVPNDYLKDDEATAMPAKAAPRSAKAKGKKRQLDPENAIKRPSGRTTFFPSLDNPSVASFSKEFWKHQFDVAENSQEDFKTPELPLARVKRVMKTDPDVVMIASEVPVILEKACQIFISDLTSRAYIDSSRRRTLTKGDIIHATTKSDMFDFLIDVAPRDYLTGGTQASNSNNIGHNSNSYNSAQGHPDGSATAAASKASRNGTKSGDGKASSKKSSANDRKPGARKRKLNAFDAFQDEDEQDDDEEDDDEDDDFHF